MVAAAAVSATGSNSSGSAGGILLMLSAPCLWWINGSNQSHCDQPPCRRRTPAVAVADEAIIVFEVDAVGVDEVERFGIADRSSTSCAKVARHPLAVFAMPADLELDPCEP